MDELTQFTIANALLSSFGGRRRSAWVLAGEVLAEGIALEDVFTALMMDSHLDRRLNTLNEAELAGRL